MPGPHYLHGIVEISLTSGVVSMAKTRNKITIAVLSYHFSLHPRAQRIASYLSKKGFSVYAWESKRSRKRNSLISRVVYGALAYLFTMIDTLRVKADILWIENVPDIVYVPLALFRKEKFILSRRSPWAHELVAEFPFLKKLYILISSIERFLISRSCIVAVVSTPMLHEYDYNKFNKEVIVIPNYPEKTFKCSHDRKLRDELSISNSTKVFLYLGKLSFVEGVDLLVKTAIALKDTNAELWIVGDGPASRLVSEIARKYDHVRWFGWIDRSEVPRFISSADYGLVPRKKRPASIFYNHEGVMKISEYLRCGLPVIASGVAPSPYYLSVSDTEFPLIVRKVALGEVTVPKPIPLPSWEETSEPLIAKTITKCLAKTKTKSN